MTRERGVVGVIFLLAMIFFASVYLLTAGAIFEGFDNSPITADENINTSLVDGTAVWSNIKTVGLQGIPLVILATGVVFALAWYLRPERFGGSRRRPPL